MRILLIGDVIGALGINYLRDHLFNLRKELKIDFCIANGENSAEGNGITKKSAKGLYEAGVDVITLGNHSFRHYKELDEIYNDKFSVIRPANFPADSPGYGYIIVNTAFAAVAVVNVLGRIYMQPIDCPFKAVDRALNDIGNKAQVIIVDFHAEATSEKQCMLYHLDGRVSALVGTHTHVQTADEKVTEKGTAYITDLGMTGPVNSILGVESDIVHDRLVKHIPRRFETAGGQYMLKGAVVDVDVNTKKAVKIERISF